VRSGSGCCPLRSRKLASLPEALKINPIKTIAIMMLSDLASEPRVMRQISLLRDHYQVIVAGFQGPGTPGISFTCLPRIQSSSRDRIYSAIYLLSRQYERYYWNRRMANYLDRLSAIRADVILAHDMTLPLALRAARGAKVIFDAHEYFPGQFQDRLLWRLSVLKFNSYFCKTYIPQADGMITVSKGIADQYEKDTGIRPVVCDNAASYVDIEPGFKDSSDKTIRMIHHGMAIPSRKLESMIDLMRHLDERFSLDMVLVTGSGTQSYLEKLKGMANGDSRIRFLPPVPMQQLVEFSSQYDIGLYLLEPNSFNHLHALPNKFFEFIQARLAVAIGPLPEMARIVRQYDCGVVSSSFDPRSLAERLMALGHEQINYYKSQSHKAAQEMCAERNKEKLLGLIEQVLGQSGGKGEAAR